MAERFVRIVVETRLRKLSWTVEPEVGKLPPTKPPISVRQLVDQAFGSVGTVA